MRSDQKARVNAARAVAAAAKAVALLQAGGTSGWTGATGGPVVDGTRPTRGWLESEASKVT